MYILMQNVKKQGHYFYYVTFCTNAEINYFPLCYGTLIYMYFTTSISFTIINTLPSLF